MSKNNLNKNIKKINYNLISKLKKTKKLNKMKKVMIKFKIKRINKSQNSKKNKLSFK